MYFARARGSTGHDRRIYAGVRGIYTLILDIFLLATYIDQAERRVSADPTATK